MPSWDKVQNEIKAEGSVYDVVRRRHLKALSDYTKRNTIVYYSGWNEKDFLVSQGLTGFDVNDQDKNGFMAVIHQLDRSKGLDLVLHTPGGSVAATESLVDYLRSMFGTDIRAIVPQIAMSAGTMIALACKSVVMGKHSNLGPIDPQMRGLPAHGVIDEFNQARADIAANPAMMAVWQPILAKYPPTFVGECVKAIQLSNTMVKEWLVTGMLDGEADAEISAEKILAEVADHAMTLSHGRHLSMAKIQSLGIKVEELEKDPMLQDLVLTAHHACTHTLSETQAIKIIENQNGIGFITGVQVAQPAAVSVPASPPAAPAPAPAVQPVTVPPTPPAPAGP